MASPHVSYPPWLMWTLGLTTAVVIAAGLSVVYYEELWAGWPNSIFGDRGDGFFCLWVLRHNLWYASQFGLPGITDAAIFFPESAGSLLKSDTFFLQSLLYGLVLKFYPKIFAAYSLVSLVQVAAALAVFTGLFLSIQRFAKGESTTAEPRQLVLSIVAGLFAVAAVYSSGWNIYYGHFQNLSAFWPVLVVVAGMWVLYEDAAWAFRLMVAAFVAASYSSQYFGLLAGCFGLLFGLCLVMQRGPRAGIQLLRRFWLSMLLGAIAVAPILYLYLGTFKGKSVGQFSLSAHDFLRPFVTSPAFPFLQRVFGLQAQDNHEHPAYLGLAFLGAVLLMVVAQGRYLRVVCPRPRSGPLMFLFLAMLSAYGLAFGPEAISFNGNSLPSIWKFYATFAPGLGMMRANGRMAPVGYGLALGLAAWLFFSSINRASPRGMVLWCLGLLLWFPLHLYEHRHAISVTAVTEAEIIPRDEEREYFVAHPGPLLALPTTPWALGTRYMHFFHDIPEVLLANGYSGTSTPFFDAVYLAEDNRMPTLAQLALARSKGIFRFVVFKDRYTSEEFAKIEKDFPKALFSNARLYVF